MELPAQQLALGGLDVLAQLEQAQGQAAAATAELLGGGRGQLFLLPEPVRLLQRRRQAHDLAAVERRQLAGDGEGPVGPGVGQVELAAAGQGPHERRVAAALVAQAQGSGGVAQGEVEARRVGVEPGGQPAQQPGGGRAEDPQPERST